jgi:hypothetical protein
MVSTRALNTWIGFFLLGPAWILTEAFFRCFGKAGLEQSFWVTSDFLFFGLGVVIWLFVFSGSLWATGRPWLLKTYVLGHEMTHGLWSFAMGGRVTGMKFEEDGGYLITDTVNVWVALAPYFYPIYSMVLVALFSVAGMFWDLTEWIPLLFAPLGASWAFHLSFTLWMIPKGQSDLQIFGTFYSLVVIYLMNLILLCPLLLVAAPDLSWRDLLFELQRSAENFSELAWNLARWVWEVSQLAWNFSRARLLN